MADTKLTAFLKKNKKKSESFEIKLDSFDYPIELRIISGSEDDAIKKKCMKKARVGRKTQNEFDGIEYSKLLAVNSIVFPPLDNTEVQSSYGAVGARDLYDKMFDFAEQQIIMTKIYEVSGIDQDINDEIEEAKN